MSGRALWIWEHLPKNLEETNDKSWLNEGDAVENVNRLKIGGHQPGSFAAVNLVFDFHKPSNMILIHWI